LHLVGILFPHINDDALSKSHQITERISFKFGTKGLHQTLFCHHSSGTRTSYLKAEVNRFNVTVLRASSYSGIP